MIHQYGLQFACDACGKVSEPITDPPPIWTQATPVGWFNMATSPYYTALALADGRHISLLCPDCEKLTVHDLIAWAEAHPPEVKRS